MEIERLSSAYLSNIVVAQNVSTKLFVLAVFRQFKSNKKLNLLIFLWELSSFYLRKLIFVPERWQRYNEGNSAGKGCFVCGNKFDIPQQSKEFCVRRRWVFEKPGCVTSKPWPVFTNEVTKFPGFSPHPFGIILRVYDKHLKFNRAAM